MAQFICNNYQEAKKYALRYPELIRNIMIQNKSLLEYDPMYPVELSAIPSKEEIILIINRIEKKYFIRTECNELYKEKLNNLQWINKSYKIKQRDFNTCIKCHNSIILNNISELQEYLNQDNYQIIKNKWSPHPQITQKDILPEYNGIKGFAEQLASISLHCYIDSIGLYAYNLSYKYPNTIEAKGIFFSTEKILKENDYWKWGIYKDAYMKGYFGDKRNWELYWQYCNLGNTDNKFILSFCPNHNGFYYSESYQRIGILSYNQYSIVFPLYKLKTRTSLEVHHKQYRKKNDMFINPWEYDDNELVTLCHECHQEIHKTPIPIIYE